MFRAIALADFVGQGRAAYDQNIHCRRLIREPRAKSRRPLGPVQETAAKFDDAAWG